MTRPDDYTIFGVKFSVAFIGLVLFLCVVASSVGPYQMDFTKHSGLNVSLFRNGRMFCSGVIVSETERLVATAAHCVEDSNGLMVEDNAGQKRAAIVAATDPKHDAAIIQVPNAEFFHQATIRDKPLTTGERVFSMTNALGHPDILGQFIVANPKVPIQFDTFRVDAVVLSGAGTCQGSSGGPIFDTNGKLVGITFGGPMAPCSPLMVVMPIKWHKHLLSEISLEQ
jgi:S1-C subfamily serine protease